MLTLSPKQFSPSTFTPIEYEHSLGLFPELDWVEFNWDTGLQSYPLLAKIDDNGQVVMVMSESAVFLNKEFTNKQGENYEWL